MSTIAAVSPVTKTPVNPATMVNTATMASPVGELTVVVSDAGVRSVLWHDDPRPQSQPGAIDSSSSVHREQIIVGVVAQLREYFDGERTEFDVPLDPVGTAFQRSAWQVLRTIPYGSTVSYGEQARRLGDPNKARAVGAANGKNPIGIIVPCHRVVGANGSLTGFAGGLDSKAWLLDHERRTIAIS